MLTTVLLWSSSSHLLGQTESNLSTGLADSTSVLIPVELLRKANIKMIERNHLKNIVVQQDSIIKFKDLYIKQQQVVINDFKQRIVQLNIDKQTIDLKLKRQERNNKLLTYGGCGIALGLIVSIISK